MEETVVYSMTWSPDIEHESKYCDSTQHSIHLNYCHFGPLIVNKV